MRHALLLALASALLAVGLASAAPKPTLGFTKGRHFVVRGSHFKPRERVTVRLVADGVRQRRSRTDSLGSFKADFGSLHIRRCEAFQLTAVGSAGDRATLKHLQPPDCITQ
jgi:hypothetical protein